MVDGKHALVVVACVAGLGAWAGLYQVQGTVPTYAAELFGTGSESSVASWPTMRNDEDEVVTMRPVVKVSMPEADEGSGTITFTLKGGAMFGASVASTDFTVDLDGATPALWVSVTDGGAKGDSSVSITVAAGGTDGIDRGTAREITDAMGTPDDTDDDTTLSVHDLFFHLPNLMGLSTLLDPSKTINIEVAAESTTGVFPDGKLMLDDKDGSAATAVSNVLVRSASAVSLTSSRPMDFMDFKGDRSVRINIDDRTMLRANSGDAPFRDSAPVPAYRPYTYGVKGAAFAAQLAALRLVVRSQVTECGADGMAPNCEDTIYQWDGTRVDSDLAGVLDIDVTGAVREGDMVFANRGDFNHWAAPWIGGAVNPRSIDSGESLTVTDGMAEFTTGGFSIDPGDADEQTTEIATPIGVYYVPNGKDDLSHGAVIHLMATVNFTESTAADESLAPSPTTELRFHGVNDAVKAYAIPFNGNGKGDKANVRIRCETGDWFTGACRPFLECWDDMGNRSFGESDMIAANALDTLNSMDIEMVAGVMDASSRHSCRVLSTGTTSVQQLTRDGSSGTLVNNTYVGGGM